MYFKKFLYLCVIALAVLAGIGYYARRSTPQDKLYAYRVTVYEPAAYFLRPSGLARDAYLKFMADSRWKELTLEMEQKSLRSESEYLRRSLLGIGVKCVERTEKLLAAKQWRRSQDLAAFCLSLPKAYERIWQEKWLTDEAKLFTDPVKDQWSDFSRQLLTIRAEAKVVAVDAKDRTDFLAGLEERLNECTALADEAMLLTGEVKPYAEKLTFTILEKDIETLNSFTALAKKNLGVGAYREAWWNTSELCASSHAVLAATNLVQSSKIKLTQPLDVLGFGQTK